MASFSNPDKRSDPHICENSVPIEPNNSEWDKPHDSSTHAGVDTPARLECQLLWDWCFSFVCFLVCFWDARIREKWMFNGLGLRWEGFITVVITFNVLISFPDQ